MVSHSFSDLCHPSASFGVSLFNEVAAGRNARRSLDSRFPVLNFPNIVRLTANDKDFSLALEMTIRESDVSKSLSHQSRIPPISNAIK